MQANPFYAQSEQNVSVPQVQINPYVTGSVDLARTR
jgi:hypothetical protein